MKASDGYASRPMSEMFNSLSFVIKSMKYTGSCHCKIVTFEATMDEPKEVMTCNCSHCYKKGLFLGFVPRAQFKILSGEDNLTEYLFNKKAISHQFCKSCGVQAFGFGKSPDGSETAMINLRCIDGLDLTSLPTKEYNGKDA